MGKLPYIISRLHPRRDKSSTKIANNTYAFYKEHDYGDNIFEFGIVYHATEIITCIYEHGKFSTRTYPAETPIGALHILAVELDTGGWNTPTTIRRMNAFLTQNAMNYHRAHTVGGKFIVNDPMGENIVSPDDPYKASIVVALPEVTEDGMFLSINDPARPRVNTNYPT